MTEQPQSEERRWRAPAVVLVAVLAIALVVTGGLALLTGGGPIPTGGAPPIGPTAPPTQPHPDSPDGFPSNESNLWVISVNDALEWARSGQADGREMAVGGWWVPDFAWSCPWPGRDTLPIEGSCTTDYLSSAPYERVSCTNNSDGSGECHANPVPSGVQVMPAMMLEETAGIDDLGHVRDARFENGLPVVLVVHVGDLRWRQCPVGSQDECSKKAIVDRVAWVAGEDVESGARIGLPTKMTADEAVTAARFEVDIALLTAFPVRLGEAWTVDPRFHGVGDDPVWVIRGIPLQPSGVPENPSRAVEVRLVDDGTGSVLFKGALGPGSDYAPARLFLQATEPMDAATGNTAIYYRVEGPDGEGLVEARMGSAMQSGGDTTTHSIAAPTLLDPGDYLVRVWRALTSGDGHAHFNECTQQVSLTAMAESLIEAAFPSQGDCTFVTPTFENAFDQ
jgi:hypothetical protein